MSSLSDRLKASGAKPPRSQVLVIGERFEGFHKNGKGYKALCPAHDDSKPSLSLNEGQDGGVLVHCHAGCSLKDILDKVELRLGDLVAGAEPPRQVVATYDYRDESGELLYQTVRYYPKDFRQRSPDGNGGWNWSTKDVPPGLVPASGTVGERS